MIKKLMVLAALSSVATHVMGDEDYDHFASLPSPDMATAYCNLQTYNQKLQDIISKPKMSPVDMIKVHELTYTLENAVIRVKETLDVLAEDLEKVHKASESIDEKTIAASGKDYLAAIESIFNPASCE